LYLSREFLEKQHLTNFQYHSMSRQLISLENKLVILL